MKLSQQAIAQIIRATEEKVSTATEEQLYDFMDFLNEEAEAGRGTELLFMSICIGQEELEKRGLSTWG
jgi:hypothetical protein